MTPLVKVVAIALLLSQVGAVLKVEKGSLTIASSSKYEPEEAGSKERPMRQIIDLLKVMQTDLKTELDEDEDHYNNMACWCDNNEKRLKKQIVDADLEVKEFIKEIERLTALISTLETQIEHLAEEIEKAEQELEQATEIRKQQYEAFVIEETELKNAVAALRAAVVVMRSHHASGVTSLHDGNDAYSAQRVRLLQQRNDAFLQMPQDKSLMNKVTDTLARTYQEHGKLLRGVLSHSDRRFVESLLQLSGRKMGGLGMAAPSWNAGSGQIFGILTQMKETFETNLKTSQDEDAAAEVAYQDLKKAKEAEIDAMLTSKREKEDQLADEEMNLAEIKTRMPNTQIAAVRDEKFLRHMQDRCMIVDKEWEVRKVTKADEIEAVTKALTMLNSEEAHELFTRNFNPEEPASFLQLKSYMKVESVSNSTARAQASKILSAVAKATHSSKLAHMADSVRLDHFARVKEAIQKMIDALVKEKADEIQTQADCNKMIGDIKFADRYKNNVKTSLEDQIQTLTDELQELDTSLATSKQEVADLLKELENAKNERKKANQAFLQQMKDQKATQALLRKAMKVLKEFYDRDLLPEIPVNSRTGVLMQEENGGWVEPTTPAPDRGRSMMKDFDFNKYEKHDYEGKDGGVMSLINTVLEDSVNTTILSQQEEADEVEAFEDFKEQTNDNLKTKGEKIAEDSQDRAAKEEEMTKKKQFLADTETEIDMLAGQLDHTHQECDFVMDNFDIRQEARDSEIKALRDAKSILSGTHY